MAPTVDQLVEELVSAIRETWGEDLIGLYLYGSFVAGGFEPDASDIEMLAVLTREAAQAFIAQVAAEVQARDSTQ